MTWVTMVTVLTIVTGVLTMVAVLTVATTITVAPVMMTRPGGGWSAVDQQLADKAVLLTVVMDVRLYQDIVLLVSSCHVVDT